MKFAARAKSRDRLLKSLIVRATRSPQRESILGAARSVAYAFFFSADAPYSRGEDTPSVSCSLREHKQSRFLVFPARDASSYRSGSLRPRKSPRHAVENDFFLSSLLAKRAAIGRGVLTPLIPAARGRKESAVKPGSVVDSHSSGMRVAAQL